MSYKMIAIDLDGTLLDENKRIHRENIDVLRRLHNNGVEIVIATGRRYWSAKRLVKEIGIDLVIMANNGNIVREIFDDKLLLTKYLELDDFYTLVRESRKKGLYPVVHVDHYHEGYDMMIELDIDNIKYSSYMTKNQDRYKRIDDFLNYKEAKVLVACFAGDVKELEEFDQRIKALYPNKYHSHIMTKLTTVGGLLEIMNPLGSKWISIKEYASNKGVNPEEIIAIGDDNNDIEMIRGAGLGIGMKNGSPRVKEVADIITDKFNNEAGVGDILKKVLKLDK